MKTKRIVAMFVVIVLIGGIAAFVAWRHNSDKNNESTDNTIKGKVAQDDNASKKYNSEEDVEENIVDISDNKDSGFVDIDIDDEFNLYDDDPEGESSIAPVGKVKVVIKGKGDFANEEFDGVVNVEGHEISEEQCKMKLFSKRDDSYDMTYLGELKTDKKKDKKERNITDRMTRVYEIELSPDLKKIYIWIADLYELTQEEEDKLPIDEEDGSKILDDYNADYLWACNY